MEKRFITDGEYAEHKTRTLPVPKGESVKYSLTRTDPVYFVVNQIGIRPYTWQAEFLDALKNHQNVLACTSRQIGKTAALAWFALWACCYNTLPMGSTKKTRIVFVSKTEGQAMKVIADVREFIRIADDRVYELTAGKREKFYSNMIATGVNTSNTKSIITFTNGCQIVSLPPTDAARGYTASQLFLDEVAFIDDEIITKVLLPIVDQTGNRVSCTSTPNGKQGWFFKMFDPDDLLPDRQYKRLWVPYTCIRHEDPDRVERKDKDKQVSIRLGEERGFKQEYEADFTASESSFFRDEAISGAVDNSLYMVESFEKECDMGIDFGKKESRTVLTLTAKEMDKEGEARIRVLWQYEYQEEKGTGQDLVEDIKRLKESYNIQRFVVEDCPQSAFFQQACQTHGWPMTVFNPSRDKNRQYHLFRSWLNQGKIRMPEITGLLEQMRGLVVIQLDVRERIVHGAGLRDDRIDSLMIATYHQTEEGGKLRVLDI